MDTGYTMRFGFTVIKHPARLGTPGLLLFSAFLLAGGYDVPTVQELLGHKDVRMPMIYTHVLNRGGRGVRSPADGLARGPGERWTERA